MWQHRPYDKNKEARFLEMGQKKLIARLLAQRDISTEGICSFMSSEYNDLSHPFLLDGIEKAVKIFIKTAKANGSVKTWGDYDADGILASVMIKELCNNFGIKCNCGLPSRLEHGYGLNNKSVQEIKKMMDKSKTDILFVLDSGTNSEKEILEIKKWFPETTIIVIDHHIIESAKMTKSADILINWHLQNNYPETCTCGEVFQFIRGIRWFTKKVNPIEFISYAAIGILADVSPIIGDNRIVIKNGLKEYALGHVISFGLNALLRKSGIYSPNVSQGDVLFRVAPRINAVGRLLSPDIAFNLLTEKDIATAELIAESLSDCNNDRKKIQKGIEKEAINFVKDNIENYNHGILLYNPQWSIGVIGIVASTLSKTFYKPSIVVGKNGESYKGSGRSLEKINLKEILDICKDMFDGYGGHAMAAGVTVKNEYIDKANAMFNDACNKYYTIHGRPQEIQYYDICIPPRSVSSQIAQLLLDTIYPYCQQSNPEPIFKIENVTVSDLEVFESKEWRSLSFFASKNGEKTELRLKTFSDKFGSEISGREVDVYFTFPQSIQKDYYNNIPQANIVDLVIKK